MPAPKPPENTTPKQTQGQAQSSSERKKWIKKTPVQIVLEQAEKLKEEIAEAEEELKAKRKQLEKFEQARKLFEGA